MTSLLIRLENDMKVHETIENIGHENPNWLRAYSQCTVAREVDMKTQHLKQILGYQVELNICLVSKLLILIHVVFLKVCKLRENCPLCIIKHLQNSVNVCYHELSNLMCELSAS